MTLKLIKTLDQAIEAEEVEQKLECTEEAIEELKLFLNKLGSFSEDFREVA